MRLLDRAGMAWYGPVNPYAAVKLGQGRPRASLVGLERTMKTPYETIITLEAGKRSGKPTVRGMRITVYDVLSYLAAGMSEREILDDFPYLTAEDIRACLSYAADRERHLIVAHT
jgi:uncharacterized protein (DUF433 family)